MLDNSITYVPESNHRIPGLGEINILYSHSKEEVKIYYGKILLESYRGEKAKEIKQEIDSSPRLDHLKISEINRIASSVCHIDVLNITKESRKSNYAMARWLVFDYLRRFNFSFSKIGEIYGKNHATIIYGINELNNQYLNGWRLDYRIKFRAEIDRIHRNAGITMISWDL